MSTIPVICHADGRRFTVEAAALTEALRCACGSADIDLDETLETTAAEAPKYVSDYTPGSNCPYCGADSSKVTQTAKAGSPLTGVDRYKCGECGGGMSDKSSHQASRQAPPPWVGSRQASFETDPEMGEVKETDSVKQKVTCSTCFTDATITATDPAQPMPPCPNCGAKTLSPAGSTLAARKTAGAFQEAVRKGLMMGMSEYLNPGAMLPSSVYVVLEPGPNGARPTDRKTSDRDEANRWAQELLDQYPNGFPFTSSRIEGSRTQAARRQAKIAEVIKGIRATNPGMDPLTARRVATQTVSRYPKMIGN